MRYKWIAIIAPVALAIFGIYKLATHPRAVCRLPIPTYKAAFNVVGTAVDLYETGTGQLPSTHEALITAKDEGGHSYIRNTNDISDGWGQPIRYTRLDDGYELRSSGPDQTFNTQDDIVQERDRHTEQSVPGYDAQGASSPEP